jgi:hypothetical protein
VIPQYRISLESVSNGCANAQRRRPVYALFALAASDLPALVWTPHDPWLMLWVVGGIVRTYCARLTDDQERYVTSVP